MELSFSESGNGLEVFVWFIYNGFFELEMLDYETGETYKSRTFEGLEEDAIEEARQWMKTF